MLRTNFTKDTINVIDALQKWRNKDHEDYLWLSRHEVCTLLDEISRRTQYYP